MPKKKSAVKPRLIQREDLIKFIQVSDPQISPSGDYVAFVRKHVNTDKNEYVTNIWLTDSEGDEEPKQFSNGGKDSHPRFDPAGQRLAFISAREKTRPQIMVLNALGGEATALTKFPEGSIGAFRWSPDGTKIAASFREADPDWNEDAKKNRKDKGLSDPPRVVDDWWYRLDGDGYFLAQRYHLYIIDVKAGEHRRIYAKDNMGGFSFDWSPDSRELVVSTNRDRRAMVKPWKDELLRINASTGKITPIPNLHDGPKDKPRWSADGKWIAFGSRVGKDGTYSVENFELWVCNPKTGKSRRLTGKTDYCLMAGAISDTGDPKFEATICWNPDSKRVFMQIGWHGEAHIASVPVKGGKVQFHTHGARIHNLGNISDDGKSLAFTMGNSTRLDDVHVSHLSPRRVIRLTDFNAPLLKQLQLSQPEMTWVKSTDGVSVQTWTIKPPPPLFKRGRKYPAILEVHGGPHAMYGVGLFHEMQLLAAQGYVVFFSNPRGSKGYGRDFCAAIRGNWGGKDWDDVQAVTAFMRKQSFVNPKRMGIMGGSYGGYMTNWAIGHSREYRAAITDRCVTNLISMAGNSDYVEEPDRYFPGNWWDDIDRRWNQSPQKYMGKARTPTLVIHSEGDLRCNVEQGEEVFSTLQWLGVPSRLVRYPSNTFHGMSRSGPPDLRLHRLGQIVDWWKKWMR